MLYTEDYRLRGRSSHCHLYLTVPKVFFKAFLKTDTKADVVINNLAKTFNGYMINAMTKHLIYMLEDIITALMQRLVMKR